MARRVLSQTSAVVQHIEVSTRGIASGNPLRPESHYRHKKSSVTKRCVTHPAKTICARGYSRPVFWSPGAVTAPPGARRWWRWMTPGYVHSDVFMSNHRAKVVVCRAREWFVVCRVREWFVSSLELGSLESRGWMLLIAPQFTQRKPKHCHAK